MALKIKTPLASPAFQDNEAIPEKYTCDGKNTSPPLVWDPPPEGTASLAILMEDPNAPAGVWVHWLVYDIPPTAGGLDEGISRAEVLGNRAKQGMSGGVARFTTLGYNGPCPPVGSFHRYFLKLFALDKMTGLAPRATKDQFLKTAEGHI